MLGFILAPLGQKVPGQFPSEIAYAYGGTGNYLCPPDPQFNTHGEQGFYYDTQLGGLGDIPTDAELAKNYGYTPVTSGWVNAAEGYFPAPWVPPGGWNAAGAYGPQRSLSGAMSSMLDPVATLATIGVLGFVGYQLLKKRKRR